LYLDPLLLPDSPAVLFVDKPGAYIGKHSERLQVRLKEGPPIEAPLMDLRHVIVATSAASISTEAIRACSDRGIPISFLSRSGTPYARVDPPGLLGTVHTRREQLLAYLDARGVEFVRGSVVSKLENQRRLLRYSAKYRKAVDHSVYVEAIDASIEIGVLQDAVAEVSAPFIEECRSSIMNLEAQAGRRYWGGFASLVGPEVNFTGRVHRGADDAVNASLNYGYGILYAQVEGAIALAGLDPYAGFMHADRPGKPSLVLDLIEEFRQPVVDRTVLALFNRREPVHLEDGRLDAATRRLIADRVLERLECREPHLKRRFSLRAIIAIQAQRAAAHFRGEAGYSGYVMRW
jgi:CRISP-associated protein Cas1